MSVDQIQLEVSGHRCSDAFDPALGICRAMKSNFAFKKVVKQIFLPALSANLCNTVFIFLVRSTLLCSTEL